MPSWNVEIDGWSYAPIPKSWIQRGRDDASGQPVLFAVSAAVDPTGRLIRVRYVYPRTGEVLTKVMPACSPPETDGPVPCCLVERGAYWPATTTPTSDVEPSGQIRSVEREHLETLWSDRVSAGGVTA